VVLSGDAKAVSMQGVGGSYAPGDEIPAGSYDVVATFDGAPVPAGKVTVSAGVTTVLSCQAAFTTCTAP
jgi:hypothetical protein